VNEVTERMTARCSSQQVGGSISTALLDAIAASLIANYSATQAPSGSQMAALVHAFSQ
jgi:hypothetical protein